MWTNMNSYRENEALSDDIISREIFYVTIVLCLNILWLKAVITARQTQTSSRKHDVIKVCSIEYLTIQIELVLPTSKSWTVHKIIEYLTLGLLLTFEMHVSITVQQLTFLTHPVDAACCYARRTFHGLRVRAYLAHGWALQKRLNRSKCHLKVAKPYTGIIIAHEHLKTFCITPYIHISWMLLYNSTIIIYNNNPLFWKGS